METNLFINRMVVVTHHSKIAYDEVFHRGVNIIRGDNSSGKSTITHLLFYGLGGSYVDFVPEAKLCKYVFVEISTAKKTYTLRREIKTNEGNRVETMSGMTIFLSNLDNAISGEGESFHFGYKTTEKKKSFSNILFDIIGIPSVIGDNNITIHQLLRLMYIDQESPTGSLYMFEPFDSQITRETTAELLMGIYDNDLYTAKLTLYNTEKKLQDIENEIKAIRSAFPSAEERSSSFLLKKIESIEEETQSLSDTIQHKRITQSHDISTNNYVENLKKEVAKLRVSIQKQTDLVVMLENEINDTTYFINALRKRKNALSNSIIIRNNLENSVLEYCPECLSVLPPSIDDKHCRLCKSPIDNTRGIHQAKRYNIEISFQIKESEIILEKNKDELNLEKAKLQRLKTEIKNREKTLFLALKDVRSPQDEEIDNMLYRKGLLEGECLQYRTMLEKALYYEQLIHQKDEYTKKCEETQRFIEAKINEQKSKRKIVEDKIKEIGIFFLRHDLNRQQEFMDASDFYVDFSNNIAYLSNRFSKYSASSSFYLKIVARFALFLSSLDLPFMRYPRFIFADNMEDKGIEEKRAQNFQKVLINYLSKYNKDDYQVIYTTSYITDELDKSSYVVGEKYSQQNKSLKNV